MDKKISAITGRDVDFTKWYTDVVLKTDLAAYSNVKGSVYIPPYGCALWENIKSDLDRRFRETGHQNVMFPLLIPESMLQLEKDHIAGFAPEVAWVTHGGEEKLAERLCIRPTSEVLFYDYFANNIHSYRDLPKLYNQWGNVVRWEKTTRPFLRTTEFFWQEGHTVHETEHEARTETMQMHKVYMDMCKEALAIPMLAGRKTESEKFAGAEETYTIEAMMHDGKALQAGTSHYFGQGFAKAFGIKFQGRDGREQTPYTTSWGLSTRIIGGIIMVHGDDNGLVMPPHVAPIQVVVVPIRNVDVNPLLKKINARVYIDNSDNTPGWKFSEWEMKGVPLRIEYGPRDAESGTCIIARRDTGEKSVVKISELNIPKLLQQVHDNMYKRALERMNSMTYNAKTIQEVISAPPGFVKTKYDPSWEAELKKHAITPRCLLEGGFVIWGKSY